MSRYHKGKCCVGCLQDWGDREKDIAECCCLGIEPNSEPTYTQSQVEAIVRIDRENLYLSMLRAKQMGSKSLWVASEFLILIHTTPIEIGEIANGH